MTTNDSAIIRDLIGIPYVPGGRVIESGLDCWGVVLIVMRRLGVELTADWHPDWVPDDLKSTIREIRNGIASSAWEPVDWAPWSVVVMGAPRRPQHAGVALPDGTVLHASEQTGVVREPLIAIRQQYGEIQCYRSVTWGK